MTVGERIKEARQAKGLTQAELGARLGLPYQSIGQWERDLRRPKLETLQRLAEELDVSWEELADAPARRRESHMTIGERIRMARLEKGLTQRELGEKSGIAEPTIRKYELGKLNPKLETLKRLALALDMLWIDLTGDQSLEYLIGKGAASEVRKAADLENAVKTMLCELYGSVEEKEISGQYGSEFYYLIGNEKNKFVLYGGHLEALQKFVLGALPAMVDQLKDTRPEQEIIDEITADLNSDESRLALIEAVKLRIEQNPEKAKDWELLLKDLEDGTTINQERAVAELMQQLTEKHGSIQEES